MATMYARAEQEPGQFTLFTLRQTRYREQLLRGEEHPHDVCAMARSIEELRAMCEKHWPDADYSLSTTGAAP